MPKSRRPNHCHVVVSILFDNNCDKEQDPPISVFFWASSQGNMTFKKITKRYKKWDIPRIVCEYTCLVVNQISVYGYGFLFKYTTVGQAPDSLTALS